MDRDEGRCFCEPSLCRRRCRQGGRWGSLVQTRLWLLASFATAIRFFFLPFPRCHSVSISLFLFAEHPWVSLDLPPIFCDPLTPGCWCCLLVIAAAYLPRWFVRIVSWNLLSISSSFTNHHHHHHRQSYLLLPLFSVVFYILLSLPSRLYIAISRSNSYIVFFNFVSLVPPHPCTSSFWFQLLLTLFTFIFSLPPDSTFFHQTIVGLAITLSEPLDSGSDVRLPVFPEQIFFVSFFIYVFRAPRILNIHLF